MIVFPGPRNFGCWTEYLHICGSKHHKSLFVCCVVMFGVVAMLDFERMWLGVLLRGALMGFVANIQAVIGMMLKDCNGWKGLFCKKVIRSKITDWVIFLSFPFFCDAFSLHLPLPVGILKMSAYEKLMPEQPLLHFGVFTLSWNNNSIHRLLNQSSWCVG